ncbi:MAG: DUF1566 domain-containing protein [Bacteroidales bacterium]|jgi:hypothetical protein|nr:DUF1566 domain-containing protein [Bacteroidales bacterium]
MQTKKFNEVSTVTTVNSGQYLILTDGNGNATKVSLADLKAAMLAGVNLNAISDGVFIMYHLKQNDYPYMIKPENWTSKQNGGELAEGVVVVEGGKILVVAPTEADSGGLLWSSAAVSAGGVTTSNRLTAMDDWAGKTNTAAQITHSECNTESYAPGFCAAYSRTNANGQGLTAGKWWLPSLGEMLMIYANMRKINYALSFINGATPLAEAYYWTSTEYSATTAWRLGLNDGYVNYTNKAPNHYRVRAVSAFIV